MARRTIWLLAWYYLNGYRRFDMFDPASGVVTPHLLDEEGNFEYQSQELLYRINQVAGRLMNMDVRPKVERVGLSLFGIQDRARAQIVAEALVSEDELKKVREQFAWLFTSLGSAGLTGHITDHPTIGLTADIEVIHPTQLMPFPSLGQDLTQVMGLMRQRVVPVDFLRDRLGTRKIGRNLDKMEWFEADAGELWQESLKNQAMDTPAQGTTFNFDGKGRGGGASFKEGFSEVARIREFWQYGPRGTAIRYAITSGDVTLEDQDLKGTETYCPIGFARFFNNGSFHGAGMFDLLFSVHREAEKLLKSVMNNVTDIDRYGVLVLPQGQMPKGPLLNDVGTGLKAMFWEPDPTAEGFTPFAIQPVKETDMPARVAQFARDIMNDIDPIKDLISEKGRVDSAAGLQFLDEQIQQSLTAPAHGVESAFGQLYKSITQQATKHLTLSPSALPVGALTLDLAGAIIDAETSTVSFDENPIRSFRQLTFTIKQVSPRSEVARKEEAVHLFELGIEQDPIAFKLFGLKEGLDFAQWNDEEQGSYETIIRNCLLLYGNGQDPGMVIITPHTSRPELQIRVLSAFMSSPVMAVASPEVVNEFRMYRQSLINFMGLTLPEAVPNPDDLAVMSQPEQALQQVAALQPPPGDPNVPQ